MTKQSAFYVAIFSTASLAVGWYWRSFRGVAAEARTREKQWEALKRLRNRLAGTVTLLAVLTAAVLYLVAQTHHHK
jgi:hypothetical protein